MVQASEVVAEQESSPSENATEVRLQVNTSSETDEETTTGDGVSARPSPRTILANSLRAHTARMVCFIEFASVLLMTKNRDCCKY